VTDTSSDEAALEIASGEKAQMMTRRTALGAGVALAAAGCAAGFTAFETCAHRRHTRPIDALLIDKTIEMPRQITALIKAGAQKWPVIGVQLDAPAHAGLMQVLNKSSAIVGISSGATLFCLERLGWDHGFRLCTRSHWCAADLDGDACQQEVAALLGGAPSSTASPSPLARSYRPSRADETLHGWCMQKSAPRAARSDRREVWA
jgi:hypothetical protein